MNNQQKRPLSVALVAGMLLAITVVPLLLFREDLGGWLKQGLDMLRNAGPAVFFVAMALLPAIGAPLSFFTLTAGAVFGPQLGLWVVIVLALGAIGANMVFSYCLARWALRPIMVRLLMRLGYSMPRVEAGDVSSLTVLIRVTPGVPFPVQNYMLGIAAVPFRRYLLLSCLIAFPLNTAILILGDALLQGRGRMVVLGLLLLFAFLAATHLVRRRYGPGRARSVRHG